MEEGEFAPASIGNFIKRNLLIVVLFSLGIILIAFGVIQIVFRKPPEINFVSQSNDNKEAKTAQKVMVDVSGAVIKPGVYSLGLESRIQDALIAAGGVSSDADRSYVSKNINLAQKLTDGAKLYIPKQGEVLFTNVNVGKGSSVSNDQNSFISINTASPEELDTLSGVGKVTAQKIIDNRPYTSLSDLVSKKIVSQKVFEKIQNNISL